MKTAALYNAIHARPQYNFTEKSFYIALFAKRITVESAGLRKYKKKKYHLDKS